MGLRQNRFIARKVENNHEVFENQKSRAVQGSAPLLFLKMTTEEGLVGWGEPVVEGRADTVSAAVTEMQDYVIGRSAGDIEDMFQILYRGGFYRGGPVLTSAISGIEQAMWDIKGKALGVPVYELLGGACREKVKVYCWTGGDRPDDVARGAQEKYDQGYRAIKMNATPEIAWIDSFKVVDEVLSRVAAIRDLLGMDLDIALDFHGRVHKAMARVLMKELEPFKLMFIEEPVLCENEEAFAELRRHTSTPIATGERNFTRWGFKTSSPEAAWTSYNRTHHTPVEFSNYVK
jgi:galactonate dehydratase